MHKDNEFDRALTAWVESERRRRAVARLCWFIALAKMRARRP